MGMLEKVKELGGQTVIYGLGDALNKILGFLLIPFYLKFLDPTDYGVVETILVTMSLMVILSNMGLPDAVFRFYYKLENQDERRNIISTIFFLCLGGQISISMFLFWNAEQFSKLLFKNSELTFLMVLASANIFFSAFKSIPLAIFRAQKRASMHVTVNFTTALVMLLMNVYFVAILEKGVFGIMLGFLCGSFTGVLFVLPTLVQEIGLKFERKFVKQILSYSIPLGLSQLPLTIIFMADRYILAQLASMSQLGVYALAHKIAKLIKEFIVMPFRLAWGPFIFSNERTKNAKKIYSKMTTYFSIVAAAAIVFVSVFAFELLNVLTSKEEYLNASQIVPVLCYAFLFFGLSFFTWTGIRLSDKTYYSTIVMAVAAGINVPLNYYLVEIYGYHGAAYTLVVTFFVVTVLSYLISSKLYFIKFEIGRISLILALSVVIVFVSAEIRFLDKVSDLLFRAGLVLLFYIILYYCGFSKRERYGIKRRVIERVSIWTGN